MSKPRPGNLISLTLGSYVFSGFSPFLRYKFAKLAQTVTVKRNGKGYSTTGHKGPEWE
jgi:hypothetical protein